MRKSLPGIGNIWLILLKDSSLASLIGHFELMKILQIFASQKNAYFTFYMAAAFFYILISSTSSFFLKKMEKNLNTHMRPECNY